MDTRHKHFSFSLGHKLPFLRAFGDLFLSGKVKLSQGSRVLPQ